MAIELTEDDHDLMDRCLEAVLKKFQKDADLTEARASLAHVITMIANDNGGFRNWMAAAISQLEEE